MNETRHLLERIAVGIEKLGEEPPLPEIGGPVVCPRCQVVNPRVTIGEQGGSGYTSEIYVEMICECGSTMYGVPLQWSMHENTETLRTELVERIQLVGNGRISRNDL